MTPQAQNLLEQYYQNPYKPHFAQSGKAHVSEVVRYLFEEAVNETVRPLEGAGRGVVTCAGGSLYSACSWISLKILRLLGCSLPFEVWYLGRAEMDPRLANLFEDVGAKVIDGREFAKQVSPRPRILNGWELKSFSVLHSSFEEVLFLDADCIALRDPTFLFSEPEYLKKGAIFWPDLPPQSRKEWIPRDLWDFIGVPFKNVPAFESGQFVVNKKKCAKELQLTWHMNNHSDYWYTRCFGDKDLFLLAWIKIQHERRLGRLTTLTDSLIASSNDIPLDNLR